MKSQLRARRAGGEPGVPGLGQTYHDFRVSRPNTRHISKAAQAHHQQEWSCYYVDLLQRLADGWDSGIAERL